MTISAQQGQVERAWHSLGLTDLHADLAVHLRQAALVGVQATLEAALQAELTSELGFAPYVRLATGRKPATQQRSGSYTRPVVTEFGPIAALKVPELRAGNRQRRWRILQRYQLAQASLLDKALYLYTLGLSLRDLQEMLYVWADQLLSRAAVNQVTLAAQTRLAAWRDHPLPATPPVLLVDGVWVQIFYPTDEPWIDRSGHQRQRTHSQECVILAVMAVWPGGQHHLLPYELARAENQASWCTLFAHLRERGLDPAAVQVLVSDGSSGIVEAVSQQLPQTTLQRCIVHKVRGLERYLHYRAALGTDGPPSPLATEDARRERRHAIKQAAFDIFAAPELAQARQRLADFVAHWQALEPEAVHNFTWGLERCFTFYRLDPALRPWARSTNLLERFFREFRTKADEIGAFPNEDTCLTVFQLVLLHEHAKHDRLDFANST
jgi:transposase-like protein